MTEYDFSPEAYEKYLDTQHRIAQWVDKTRRYVPSNPFVPTTPAARYAALRQSRDSRHDRTDPHRHHRSHSSKHPSRRYRSSDPPPPSLSRHHTVSHSTAPPMAPPTKWHTAVDRRTDGRIPHSDAATYAQYYSVPPRPIRANTAPVYLYPVADRNSYPHASVIPETRIHGRMSAAHAAVNPGKREPLFKRLLGGIIGKHNHGAKGRRRDSG
ncbi:hypothetical protein APHAL10511_007071 [Amanita phalloides]|nr:hypothetical protein APHAL10511_007071 [Amanita phalloides]